MSGLQRDVSTCLVIALWAAFDREWKVMDPLRYDTELASSEYLQATLPELRAGIDAEDDDRLVGLIEQSRTQAGEQTAYAILTHLLRLARNPLTEGVSAACIEIAVQRYQANHVSLETLKNWNRWSSQND